MSGQDAGALPLGFGTAHLSLRAGWQAGVTLVRTALDEGITHIDAARLYGEGTAERLVGEALRGRRDEVFLVTKGGIDPAINSPARRVVNKALAVGRRVPGAAGVLPAPSYAEPRFGRFEIDHLRRSLETSLRALRTQGVDLFLLHEVSAADLVRGDLAGALADWQQEGVIAGWGIASTPAQTMELLTAVPGRLDAVQTASTLFDPLMDRLQTPGRLTISHSWLGGVAARLKAAFETDPGMASCASRVLGRNVRSNRDLAAVLLGHARSTNPGGPVLFSTSRPERIRQMAAAAREPLPSKEQLSKLAEVARQAQATPIAETG